MTHSTKISDLFCFIGLPFGEPFAILISEGEARAEPLEIKKMNSQANLIAIQIANNAYNGFGSSVQQVAASLDFSVEIVNDVVSVLVKAGKAQIVTVMVGNHLTNSQRSADYVLPVIEGKPRGYADRHIFNRKDYVNAVIC